MLKHYRSAEFKKYDTTTQVVNLPGGKKRDYYQIKDDYKYKKSLTQDHQLKFMRDYCSSITCLKSSQTINNQNQENRCRKNYIKETPITNSSKGKIFGIPSHKMPHLRLKRKKHPTTTDLFKSQIKLI